MPFAVRQVTQTCRPWRKMDRAAFNAALLSSPLCARSEDELRHMTSTELFDVYDATLRQIADDHAPASTTVRRIRPLSRWFDSDCRMSRRKTRQLERRYRRSFSDADCAAWIAHCTGEVDACLVSTEGELVLDDVHIQQCWESEEAMAIVVKHPTT